MRFLAALPDPPATPAALTIEHMDLFRAHRSATIGDVAWMEYGRPQARRQDRSSAHGASFIESTRVERARSAKPSSGGQRADRLNQVLGRDGLGEGYRRPIASRRERNRIGRPPHRRRRRQAMIPRRPQRVQAHRRANRRPATR